jgi:plastocyanin
MSKMMLALLAAALAAPAAAANETPVQGGGSVSGVIKVKDPGRRKKIKMDADAKCAALHAETPQSDELVADETGAVQYALVYVSKGLEGKTFEAPKTPAVIDQKGCRYEPHVVNLMIGQDLLIKNSDDLLHNIHALPFENKEFNFGQPSKGMEEKKQFTKKEILKVKCDVHPWMSAWVGVFEHPFHAVTAPGGKFEIKGLPAGKYTVTVWHEKYKDVSQEIEVKDGAATPLNVEMAEKKE